MNIRVDLNTPIFDGAEVVFRSPVDCSQITGLILYYPDNGNTVSKEFAFADAHGNNVGDIDHLFAENVVVKVILDVTTSMAFVQNADTNAYLESRFDGVTPDDSKVSSKAWSSKNTIDKLCPTFTERGAIVTCEPVEGYPLDVKWQTKNLINPIAYMTGNDNPATTLNGDVFTSVTTNGSTYLNTGWGGKLKTHPAGTYTVTVIPVSEGINLYVVINSKASGTQLFYKKANASNGYTLTFTAKEEFYLQITGGDSTMWGTHSYKLQLEEGATATAYEPYAETATITRCGKNLVAYPYAETTRTVNGITFTDNKDGSITINGTANAHAVFYLGDRVKWNVKPGEPYTGKLHKVSGSNSGTIQFVANYYAVGQSAYWGWMTMNGFTPTTGKCPSDMAYMAAYLLVLSGTTCTNLVVKPQMEYGTVATEYVPYQQGGTFAQGEQIPALKGVNTIFADVGIVTVTGKANPAAEIEKLKNAILAMGANV